MYLREGVVKPGDEARVERLERKMFDFERDVARVGKKKQTSPREDIDVENKLEGYWCEGEKCLSSRTHWVLHSSETICWNCWHDPCVCAAPLVWDEAERAYYLFFCHVTVKPRTTSGFLNQKVTGQELLSDAKRRKKKTTLNEGKKRKIAPTINGLHRTKGSVATTMRRD
jgi:hypothetical protein